MSKTADDVFDEIDERYAKAKEEAADAPRFEAMMWVPGAKSSDERLAALEGRVAELERRIKEMQASWSAKLST